jgi:hypothetical protein
MGTGFLRGSSERGARMKLTTTTNLSVDGVMQGHRRGGFDRGGWVYRPAGRARYGEAGYERSNDA